jgi:hypothetical protein
MGCDYHRTGLFAPQLRQLLFKFGPPFGRRASALVQNVVDLAANFTAQLIAAFGSQDQRRHSTHSRAQDQAAYEIPK